MRPIRRSLRWWPVRTEVGVGVVLRPAVEDLCKCGGLPATRRQVLLQHEHEHGVAFDGEVRDILGDDSAAFRPGDCRHLGVVGAAEAHLGDVDRVMTVGVAQEYGCGRREHLVDQEGCHASSVSRCCDVLRLRSAMARLRSIRSRTSSECSAA